MSMLLEPSNETGDPNPGFLKGGMLHLRKVLRGRSLLVLLGIAGGVLVLEVGLGTALLAGQYPDAEFQGYRYGPNVGASVAQSPQFDMPYIEDDVVAVSPDGQSTYALAVLPNALKVFDSSTLQLRETFTLNGAASSITATQDGRVFVLSGDRTIESFATQDGRLTATGTIELQVFGDDFVSQLEVSPDGNSAYAILSDDDTKVVRFNTADGSQLASGAVDNTRVVGLGVAAQAGTVFAITETAISAFDPLSLQTLASYTAEGASDPYNYYHLSVSDLGNRVFFPNAYALLDFDGSTLTPVGSYSAYGLEAFSPSGTVIFAGGGSELGVSDSTTGEEIFSFPIEGIWATPVALPDPSAGFILAPYVSSSSGEKFSAHLARYTSDGPRITVPGLLVAYAAANAALILLALLAVFLWLPFKRWRAGAPARAARSEVLVAQLREQQEVARKAADEAREKTEHDARVLQLAQWRAAYAELNPGQEIPPMPGSAFTTPSANGLAPAPFGAQNRTNTMAILALIFGLGGGLLGIIFGHIALSQISRSHESGRGLAIAGLIFGYLGLIAIVILLVVYFSALRQLGL